MAELDREVNKILDERETRKTAETFVGVEVLGISTLSAWHLHSWWVFFGLVVCLYLLFKVRLINVVLMFLFTCFWTWYGFEIGWWGHSIPLAIALAIIAFVLSASMHIVAFKDVVTELLKRTR